MRHMASSVGSSRAPTIEPGLLVPDGSYPVSDAGHWLIAGIAFAAVLLVVYAECLVDKFSKSGGSNTRRHYFVFLTRLAVTILCGTLVFALASRTGYEVEQLKLPLRIFLLIVASALACWIFVGVSDYARIIGGSQIESDVLDQHLRTDTFKSRVLGLAMMIVVVATFLVVVNEVLGLKPIVTASGAAAIIVLVITYAQSSFAPDYFNGLIILQTRVLSPGDSVWLTDHDESFLAEILRIGVFHTDLIRYIDNQRMVIANTQMRAYKIRNFTRLASARGRREALNFKIGYDVPPKMVRRVMANAFEELEQQEAVGYNAAHGHSVHVSDTGDHAVEWTVYYYTREAKTLLSTRQKILEKILEKSIEEGVSLGTPLTHSVDVHDGRGLQQSAFSSAR